MKPKLNLQSQLSVFKALGSPASTHSLFHHYNVGVSFRWIYWFLVSNCWNYKDTQILNIIFIRHSCLIQCHNLKSRQINCIQFLVRIQGQKIKSFWSFWILFTSIIKKAACCLIRWGLGGRFINLLIPWREKPHFKNKSTSKTYMNAIHLHWEHISVLCQIENFLYRNLFLLSCLP